MKTTDKHQLKDGEDEPPGQNSHVGKNHDSKPEHAKSCHENYGFEDDTMATSFSETSTTNNNNASERLRLNNKDSTTLSENEAKTNFNDVEAGHMLPVNGSEIELVNMNLNGSKGSQHPEKINGNAYVTSKITSGKDDKGHPLMDTPQLTDYFIPVNTHRKLLRGEKLYVTKDRRSRNSKRLRKVIICGIVWTFVAIVCVMAALAATGIIISKPDAESTNTVDNFSELSSSDKPMDLPLEMLTVGTSIEPTLHPTVSLLDPSLKNIEGSMQITNLKYDDALSDPNSLQFQSLSSQLENKLFEVFNALSIWSVSINGYRPGSVWVEFSLVWKDSDIALIPSQIENHFHMYLDGTQWFLKEYKINQSCLTLSDFIHPTPPASIHEETISTFFYDENSLFSHEHHDSSTTPDHVEMTRYGDVMTTTSPPIDSTEKTSATETTTSAQFPWHLFGYTSQISTTETTTTEKSTESATRNTNYWRAIDGWNIPYETTTETTTETPLTTTESSSTVGLMHEDHSTSDKITDLWIPPFLRTTTMESTGEVDFFNKTDLFDSSTLKTVIDSNDSTTTEGFTTEITTSFVSENSSDSIFGEEMSITPGEQFNETTVSDIVLTSDGIVLSELPTTRHDDLFNIDITNVTETTIDNSTVVTESSFNTTETPHIVEDSTLIENAATENDSVVRISDFSMFDNFTETTDEKHDVFVTTTPSILNFTSTEINSDNTSTEGSMESTTITIESSDFSNTTDQNASTSDYMFSTLSNDADLETTTNFYLDNISSSLNDRNVSESTTVESHIIISENENSTEFTSSSTEGYLLRNTTPVESVNETLQDFSTNDSLQVNFNSATFWPILLMNKTDASDVSENETSSIGTTETIDDNITHDHVAEETTTSAYESNVTESDFVFNSTLTTSANNPLSVLTWTKTLLRNDNESKMNHSMSTDRTDDIFVTTESDAAGNATTTESSFDNDLSSVGISTTEKFSQNFTNDSGLETTVSSFSGRAMQSDNNVTDDDDDELQTTTSNASGQEEQNGTFTDTNELQATTSSSSAFETESDNFTNENELRTTIMSFGFEMQNVSSTTETILGVTSFSSVSNMENETAATSLDGNVETTTSSSSTNRMHDVSTTEAIENTTADVSGAFEKSTVSSIFNTSQSDSTLSSSQSTADVSDFSVTLQNDNVETTSQFSSRVDDMTESVMAVQNTSKTEMNTTTQLPFSTPTIITKANFNKTQAPHDRVYFTMNEDRSEETVPYSSGLELNVTVTFNGTATLAMTTGTTPMPSSSTEETDKVNSADDTTSTETYSITDDDDDVSTTMTSAVLTTLTTVSEESTVEEIVKSTTSTELVMPSSTPVIVMQNNKIDDSTTEDYHGTSETTDFMSTSTSTPSSTASSTVNEFNEVTYSFDATSGPIPRSLDVDSEKETTEVKSSSTVSSILDTTMTATTEHETSSSSNGNEKNYYDIETSEEVTSTTLSSSLPTETQSDSLHLEYSAGLSDTKTSSMPTMTTESHDGELNEMTDHFHNEINTVTVPTEDLPNVRNNGTKATMDDKSTESTNKNDDATATVTTVETTTTSTGNNDGFTTIASTENNDSFTTSSSSSTGNNDFFTTTANTKVAEHPNEINDDNVKQYGVQENSQKSNSNRPDQLNKSDDAKNIKEDEVAQEIHYGDDSS